MAPDKLHLLAARAGRGREAGPGLDKSLDGMSGACRLRPVPLPNNWAIRIWQPPADGRDRRRLPQGREKQNPTKKDQKMRRKLNTSASKSLSRWPASAACDKHPKREQRSKTHGLGKFTHRTGSQAPRKKKKNDRGLQPASAPPTCHTPRTTPGAVRQHVCHPPKNIVRRKKKSFPGLHRSIAPEYHRACFRCTMYCK